MPWQEYFSNIAEFCLNIVSLADLLNVFIAEMLFRCFDEFIDINLIHID